MKRVCHQEGRTGLVVCIIQIEHLIHTDKRFDSLTKWINSGNAVCSQIGLIKKDLLNGWINFYEKGDYQEIHEHTQDCTISVVYYLKTPKIW